MNNNTENHWYNDLLNHIPKFINQGIYLLLTGVYAVLINIADSEIISGATVSAFFSRVQLIIGVYMIFRLTVTALQGIVSPDQFTDSKSGVGSIITKIITGLALLTMLVPIAIPKAESEMNSFEKNISSSGLLFGILYDFQHRILTQNVLAKLVLGTNTASSSSTELTDVGHDLSSIVLKSFFTPNLKEGEDENFEMEIGSDGISRYKEEDLFCIVDEKKEGNDAKEVADKYEEYYKSNNTTEILNMINQGCESEYINLSGWDAYAFNFNWFVALIVGIIFLVVLVMLCIEVAKRAIKLALLRLIAPIPIISYMGSTKSNMDNGTLGAWIKTLTSTYIDLFLYLIVTFFAIFVIGEINKNGLVFGSDASGTVVLFSKIFIYIGLLLFAQEAPKFLKQALGMKDDGGKGFFSGLGKMAGLGAAAAGAVGSGIASGRASYMADDANGKNHNFGRMAKNVGAGLLGGVTGMATGTKAALTSKDHAMKNAFDAMQKRNTMALAAGDAGSTAFGRGKANIDRLFTGETSAAKMKRDIQNMEGKKSALEAVKSRMSGEMQKKDWTYGNLGIATDSNGNAIGKVNYKSFMAAKNAAASAGENTVSFKDHTGARHTISMEEANMQEGFLLKNNENDYIQKATESSFTAEDGRVINNQQDKVLVGYIQDAQAKGETVSDRSSVTDRIDNLDISIREAKTANAKNEQNDRFSGSK